MASTNNNENSILTIYPTTSIILKNIKTNNDNEIYLTAFDCYKSKSYMNEINLIFKDNIDIINESLSHIITITTMQQSRYDLVNWGGDIDIEKDRLLELFFEFAKILSIEINNLGYWIDYIDPCSGLPMIGNTNTNVFDEVANAEKLLKYKVMNAGCCKILLHPTWGSAVYPASIFTTAPADTLIEVLNSIKSKSI